MLSWLAKRLLDKGWNRFLSALFWVLGTKKVLTFLVNDNLATIVNRYQLLEEKGFFEGVTGSTKRQDFLWALFAYDVYQTDAFAKALNSSSSAAHSLTSLREFFDFIKNYFWQDSDCEGNKQAFIDAVLMQHNDEDSALARAARVRHSSPQAGPLMLVLASLRQAGCFVGENKQKLMEAILRSSKSKKNALFNALQSRDTGFTCPNLELLLTILREVDCFSSAANKQTFREAVLSSGVLNEVVWLPDALARLYEALAEADCFANENNKQAFIDTVFSPNTRGQNALTSAAFKPQSLKLMHQYLKDAGCFDDVANKQKLIKAILAPTSSDQKSALLNATGIAGCDSLALDMLREAGCFEHHKQAFIEAALRPDRHGTNCLFFQSAAPLILKQLTELNPFQGLFASQNKTLFINAVLAPTTASGATVLARSCSSTSFPLIIEQLIAAGCFDDARYKTRFLDHVRANNYSIFIGALSNKENYLALRQGLFQAGFSAGELKKLLNQPIKQCKHDCALEMVMRLEDDAYTALLKADGAELPEQPTTNYRVWREISLVSRDTLFSKSTSFSKQDRELVLPMPKDPHS